MVSFSELYWRADKLNKHQFRGLSNPIKPTWPWSQKCSQSQASWKFPSDFMFRVFTVRCATKSWIPNLWYFEQLWFSHRVISLVKNNGFSFLFWIHKHILFSIESAKEVWLWLWQEYETERESSTQPQSLSLPPQYIIKPTRVIWTFISIKMKISRIRRQNINSNFFHISYKSLYWHL